MKWRFFRHLRFGGDDDAERVYRWHIEERSGARMKAGVPTDKWKMSLDDYVGTARTLFEIMLREGFYQWSPVPIDRNGELLDGSHRLACALALDVELVPVVMKPTEAWAPPWGWDWFVEHGMAMTDLSRLRSDWNAIRP